MVDRWYAAGIGDHSLSLLLLRSLLLSLIAAPFELSSTTVAVIISFTVSSRSIISKVMVKSAEFVQWMTFAFFGCDHHSSSFWVVSKSFTGTLNCTPYKRYCSYYYRYNTGIVK